MARVRYMIFRKLFHTEFICVQVSCSIFDLALKVKQKNFLALIIKAGRKDFLKWDIIGLLIQQPTHTADLADPVVFYCACQFGPQNNNLHFQKFYQYYYSKKLLLYCINTANPRLEVNLVLS